MLLYMREYSREAANTTAPFLGGRFSIVNKKEKSQKHLEESRASTVRKRLGMAKVVCERNERGNHRDNKTARGRE